MAILAHQLARGRGKFRIRAVIEGWPYIYVDHPSLVRTTADGRRQIEGLIPTSVRFAARAELARGELSAQEMTLELVDTAPGYLMTRALHTTPQRRTWLTADVGAYDTTIPVADTSGWPDALADAADRVIHIGTEAIAYTSKTATSFTGCTRGHWDSPAQAHTIGDADESWYPPVTDVPRELTGRRVVFYLYGSAESAASLGVPRWRSIARGGVDFGEKTYAIALDPVTLVLEQQLGTDLENEVPIRGAYFPSQAAWRATFHRHDGPTVGHEIAASFTVALSGFYATQHDVVDEINAQIGLHLGSFGLGSGTTLEARVTEDGYEFVLVTGSTPYYVSIVGAEIRRAGETGGPWPTGVSPVDTFAEPRDGATAMWRTDAGDAVPPSAGVTATSEYTTQILAPMPRTWTQRLSGSHFRGPPGFPLGRIYLGGGIAPSVSSMALVAADEDSEPVPVGVDAASISERWIEVNSITIGKQLGPDSRVKLMRLLATGDVGDLITALVTDSPDLAAYGAMPLITADDFVLDFTELRAAIGALGLGASREFFVSEGVSLGQLLAEELKLVGCYLALDSQGRMVIRRLRLATPTDVSVRDVDSSKVKGSFPKMSASPDGILGQVLIKQGYDPVENKHTGIPILVRNTTSPTKLAGTLMIAPLSRAEGAVGRVEIDPEHAYQLASAVLGTFGETYEIVSLEVGLELDGLAHGDTVLLSTPHLPGADGTMGIVEKPAQVLGYDWSPYEGRGSLDLLLHHRRVAGYSPAFPITNQEHKPGPGTEWGLVVTVAGYAPSGTDASTWLAPGDKIRIIERDTATPTRITGRVVAAGATAVTVALDMSLAYALAVTRIANLLPAPGSETWSTSVNVVRTTGQADPAGGTNAVHLDEVSGTGTAFSTVTAVSYTSGHSLWASIFVKKQTSPGAFAAVALGYDSVRKYLVMRLDAPEAQVRPGWAPSDSITDISVADLGDWLFLSFKDHGETASTVRLEIFPAYGTAYPTPDSAATGSVTVYGPRIADATVNPDAADPTRAWLPGSSEWRLGYDRAPRVDESAPAGRRWAQSDFAFDAGPDRRIGFASGDVDAVEFSP